MRVANLFTLFSFIPFHAAPRLHHPEATPPYPGPLWCLGDRVRPDPRRGRPREPVHHGTHDGRADPGGVPALRLRPANLGPVRQVAGGRGDRGSWVYPVRFTAGV